MSLVLAWPSLGTAQTDAPAVYQQSAPVLARYPDVPIRLDAPGVAPGRTTFTSQQEMEAHLAGLKARAPRFLLGSLGSSSQGRNLPYLVFTAEGLTDLERVRRLQRPVVWLVGQQHGNEPAGGEAMLALASALADGELRPLLRRMTVVVVPRANPDGAAAFSRVTAQGFDLNRDHLLATLPESRALQAFMRRLPPDVMVDAHEYGVAGGWITRLGGLAPWDATLLHATHPEVPEDSTALAQSLFGPAMDARLREAGLSSHVYLTLGGQGRTIQTGGAAPGISRNYYGLTGAVSFLVETRGIGIGRQSFQRRVATHYQAAKAVLETVAREPGRVRRTVAQARRDLARDRSPLVVGHTLEPIQETLPMVDPETGREKPVDVTIQDSRRLRVTATRPRPQGYLLAPGAASAVEAFRIKGMRVCRVRSTAPVAVEAFRVRRTAPITRATREATNLEQTLEVSVEGRTVSPSSGWVYVPMAQEGSAVAAASLEPDSVGSHVGVGLIEPAADGIAPVYRVPVGAKRPRLSGGPGCR
ncbi:MAG TPA: M14 family metallocarboxypeptidase [Caulobacteraceae bacterium]